MTSIVTVLGARPQFITVASVSCAIGEQEGVSEILVHTGPYFDANMSDVSLDEPGIPTPDYHLAGALAAAKLNIPVTHVEARLRSFNWSRPGMLILLSRLILWSDGWERQGVPAETVGPPDGYSR